ncbi:hypothetical protein TH63_12030 [Rufibacter radiotolerans]|uniref:Uncharacterized protein n=1 Tax=Rufibacter radiotolerans TaxID=1379910 RepID=A0A0H4W6Y0_9BACT|nr:hypothetical protein [Rufibacter radiotolerans]AKQ46186.1 hypothetical protein TH63_12030 [Rufibacter radiotolerans]
MGQQTLKSSKPVAAVKNFSALFLIVGEDKKAVFLPSSSLPVLYSNAATCPQTVNLFNLFFANIQPCQVRTPTHQSDRKPLVPILQGPSLKMESTDFTYPGNKGIAPVNQS